MRLRVTALPLVLETTSPRRGGPGRPGDLTTTIPPWRQRLPSLRTLRKSGDFRRVSSSGSETLSALPTTRLQRGAAGTGLHAMTKAMTALPLSYFRLIGPLHGKANGVEGRVGTGYGERETYVKASRPSRPPDSRRSRRLATEREKKIWVPWSISKGRADLALFGNILSCLGILAVDI